MKTYIKLIKIAALCLFPLLGMTSISNASSINDCGPDTSSFQQCRFEIPSLKNGESKVVTSETRHFKGATAAACRGGTLIVGKSKCETVNPNDCQIPSAQWSSDREACEHEQVETPLRNGESRTIGASTGLGSVSYSCDSGNLQVKNSTCGLSSDDMGFEKMSSQSANIQTVWMRSHTVRLPMAPNNSPNPIHELKAACEDIIGQPLSPISPMIRYEHIIADIHTGQNTYELECPVTRALACDEQLQYRVMTGTMDGGRGGPGEFTNPPNHQNVLRVCTDSSMEFGANIIVHSPADRADRFNVVNRCVNPEKSSCSNPPPEDGCKGRPLPYNTQEPYIEETIPGGRIGFQVAILPGEGEGFGRRPPSQSSIAGICTDRGTTYHRTLAIIGNDRTDGNYEVQVECKTTTSTTQKYLDLCAPEAPPENCDTCVAGQLNFTDSSTGNACSLSISGDVYSGHDFSEEFQSATHYGAVETVCDNGTHIVQSGECYKKCMPQTIRWGSGNACSQSIDPNLYAGGVKGGESVPLGSSVSHTGSATATCNSNTGEWSVSNAVCNLDCTGRASWGSGTSNSSVNKNGLCGNNVSSAQAMSHGETRALTNTTSGATGTATVSCSNGEFQVSGGSCNVSCPTSSQSWGGACMASVPALNHGGNRTVSHGSNPSHPYSSTISGSASFSCNDGYLSRPNDSCDYVVSVSTGSYGSWSEFNATDYGTWSPARSTVNQGASFTQTRGYTSHQESYKTETTSYSDGTTSSRNVDRRTRQVLSSESRSSTGTKVYATSVSTGSYGSWSEFSRTGYSSWAPATSTVTRGTSFTQTRGYTSNQESYRVETTRYSNGTTSTRNVDRQTRPVPSTETRSATGTKTPPPPSGPRCSGVMPSQCEIGGYVCDCDCGYWRVTPNRSGDPLPNRECL